MNRTRMTKTLTVLLVLATLLAAFAGCTVKNGGPADNTPAGEATEAPGETPTEAPKEEIDMSNYPLYVDPEQATYAFGERGKRSSTYWNNLPVYAPYWEGNIIYNETVMCIDDGTRKIGALLYAPVKVLSVRDYTMTTEYQEGVDYRIEGNKIILTDDTSCPYLTTENLNGKNIPSKYRSVSSLSNVANIETDYFMWTDNIFFTEGSLIYGHQLCVSYVYDLNDLDTSLFPQYGTIAPKFLEKLKDGEKVVISVTGDSVTAGCSASNYFNHEPRMVDFMTLMKYGLSAAYEGKITIKNFAVGGTTSNEAVSTKVSDKLIKGKSDLVLIHFGINDSGGVTPTKLKSNIKKVIEDTRAELPDCEFIYIKCFTANPVLYPQDKFEAYWKAVDELAAEIEGVYTIDLYTPSLKFLETKKYLDVTGNGINHPNDFTVRFYAMNLLAPFIDHAGFAALSAAFNAAQDAGSETAE